MHSIEALNTARQSTRSGNDRETDHLVQCKSLDQEIEGSNPSSPARPQHFVYRLLGEVLFNVTNNTGTRYGTKVKTTTASSAYLDPVEAATSGRRDLVTC